MTVRASMQRSAAPLARGTTYRRGVFLLLGGVVLLPYVLLAIAFVQMLTGDVPRIPVVVLLGVTAAIAMAPAFLRPTRELEIHAVRGLLEVDVPDPPPVARSTSAQSTAGRRSVLEGWETRVATALWYGCHLIAGGVVATALFVAMPVAIVYVLVRLGLAGGSLVRASDLGVLAPVPSGWLTLLAIVTAVAIVYLVAWLGELLARLAPVLLGPSAAERVAALEATAAELAERNSLARELHDSVGHALTVTTLQAAAARTVFDRDPAFARRALEAIEDAGRAAMTDLDHVIGLLRAAADGRPSSAMPQPTLSQLDGLVDDIRGAGLDLDLAVAGSMSAPPAVISREGYRIAQEALTNAVRHGGRGRAVLQVRASDAELAITARNALPEPGITRLRRVAAADTRHAGESAAADSPGQGEPLPSAAPRGGGGRGLPGMRERVRLLAGTMSAGPCGTEWVVAVRLPYGPIDRGSP